ncbi:hypothetical protein ANTRET_LOCUS11151, partial [Anthophora retusa]
IFIFSTVMKIVPIYFLVNVVPLNKIFLLFIFLGFFIIPIIMIELNSVKIFIRMFFNYSIFFYIINYIYGYFSYLFLFFILFFFFGGLLVNIII